ncbi:MAG: O-antigen ligase family protein [Blautia sp.]
MISSVHNYGIWGISAIMNDFLHPFSVLAIFIIPLIVTEASGINKVAKVFLRCSYVYFIPTMATVILAGRVDAGWYEPYFVGNKFLLTYYFLVMFCSWGIIHIEEIQNTVKAKVKVIAFCVVGMAFSAYLYCTTGVVCYLTVLILMLVLPIRKILEKPLSIAIATVLSGALPLSMTAILSIPRVNALLLAINETATMNARVRIYEILMSIITQKYWLGYGYNTLIVKERLYSNAQNGMLHIIVQFGMLGAAALVLLCYIATRNRYKRNKDVVEWCEFWLFALIVAGIIEITFGVFFYVFLALINCATNAKEERRDEDAIY